MMLFTNQPGDEGLPGHERARVRRRHDHHADGRL